VALRRHLPRVCDTLLTMLREWIGDFGARDDGAEGADASVVTKAPDAAVTTASGGGDGAGGAAAQSVPAAATTTTTSAGSGSRS